MKLIKITEILFNMISVLHFVCGVLIGLLCLERRPYSLLKTVNTAISVIGLPKVPVIQETPLPNHQNKYIFNKAVK